MPSPQRANYHTHTTFSDGRSTVAEVVAAARAGGLDAIGITDHAPIPGRSEGSFGPRGIAEYRAAVLEAREAYAGRLDVYLGMEVDYLPGLLSPHHDSLAGLHPDYVIGAVHYIDAFPDGRLFGFEASEEQFVAGVREVFDGDFRRAMERYYELIREMLIVDPPDVVAHLDRARRHNRGGAYFDEQADWYRDALAATLDVIAAAGVVMEVNTKGLYRYGDDDPYPGRWALRRALDLGIPVHLASDAHDADVVDGGHERAAEILGEVGYRAVAQFVGGTWVERELSAVQSAVPLP